MQRYHELFNYKSAFRILSKGRVVLAVSAFFSGTTLLFAAPTGGVVTTGNASISSGSSTTTITQTTNKASINWQSFNIAPSESVNFVQPNSSSVTLNRVVGTSNSLIEGALNANGQVFLINPNGVIFGNGAQVNVGGIVATTLNISDADFQAGNYKFSGDSTASVLNMGTINVASGGYAVLAGKNVENSGLIAATLGNVQLTGASAMTLNLNGNSLVNLTIDKGTLDALVANKGIIKADGGIVYLTTQALDTVLNGMVNNTGIIEANSLDMQNGKVVLYAHAGTTNVDGTLSVTNGSLETSGNLLHVSDTTTIKAKSWLLDPTNITIASGGTEPISGNPAGTSTTGDVTISADVIDATLNAGTDVTLSATNNIAVNQDMTWSSTNKLTLAADSINVNNTINNTNVTNGGVYFQAANTTDNVIFGVNGKVIINNPFQLQWMNTALAGTYQLGSNIDASATSTWNSDAGFVPIGNDTTNFTGTFDGLGHTISNLTINIPSNNYVGLFGYTSSTAVIKNVGLVNENVKGAKYVGGLVGQKYNGDISNSYATGSVSGSNYVGGLVGSNTGTISTSYATGSVSGTSDVGGLVGSNYGGTISNSYATGSVSGTGSDVGGLVGLNFGNITNSYWDIDSTGKSVGVGVELSGPSTTLIGIHSFTGANAYSLATYSYLNIAEMSNTTNPTSTWVIIDGYTRPFLRSEYSTTISNDHQLQLMAMNLNATYTLAANIDATGIGAASGTTPVYSGMWANTGFVPIGNIDTSFTGTFDGLGHTISGLTINTSSDYVGLFGSTSSTAVIKNVGLVNENVKGAKYVGGLVGANYGGTISNSYATGSVSGSNYVGGLVGYNDPGTISNSYATGSVSGTDNVGGLVGYNNGGTITDSYAKGSVSGSKYVGGLVGDSSTDGHISNSYATGSVNGTDDYVGGLVGHNGGTISNSYATGSVSATGSNVGGLVGLNNNNGTISTSYATGSVSGTGYYVGGLVGANYSGDISNSYATGEVISTGTGTSYYVGGLVGYNNGKITTSYATGNVSGTETIYYVGGLVGQNYNKGEITNSYATGNVGGTGTEIYLGGLVGDNTGTITTSYATGSVSGYRSVGGLVGQNSGTISKSFWDTETSGMSTDGASSGTTGKTTAEMKNIATFTGWNIHIDDSLSNVYPQLKGVGIESYWVIGSYAGSHDTSIANQEVTRKTPTNILAPIANQAVTHETPAGLDHPDFHPEAPRLVSSASGETMAGGRYVSFTNGGMRLPTGLEQDDESNNNQRRGR